MLGQFHPVAMAPDVWKPLEIRGAILRAVRIVPESDRHRWERGLADELALVAANRMAVLVEHVDVEPESATLKLAAPDR